MSLDNRPIYAGGCQCGAVRFRIEGALGKASICHCRMCQKAFGNFFAPLVDVPEGALTWTTREPDRFQSSNHVRRGFCADCGTPLTYEPPTSLALAIGAFDDPTSIAPAVQFGTESKLPFFDDLSRLSQDRTDSDCTGASAYLKTIESRQHPDHEARSGGNGHE